MKVWGSIYRKVNVDAEYNINIAVDTEVFYINCHCHGEQ